MKFVVFVEGKTERAVPPFLKRWLDQNLSSPVGMATVKFAGCSHLVKDAPDKAAMYLNGPKQKDIIAVISLLDLYELRLPYPAESMTMQDRYTWARQHLESKVNQPRFYQFFAVHETEAWLLSNPDIFPREIKQALDSKSKQPETVNFDEPPGKLLERLYKHRYKKPVDGLNLFRKLDPDIAYNKCPYLKLMLDEMLQLAKVAGL